MFERHCTSCSGSFPAKLNHCPRDGTRMNLRFKQPIKGMVFANRYELLGNIKEQNGAVLLCRARDLSLEKLVAFELLLVDPEEDCDSIEAMRRQTITAANLQHPHIVRVLDGGTAPFGMPYTVMEYVEGIYLSDVLIAGKLSVERTISIAIQVANALRYMHSKEFVHGSLSPFEIVLLSPTVYCEDRAVIVGTATCPNLMQSKVSTEDAHYMSPERALGQGFDAPADVYSLAAILYKCISNQNAFAGTEPAKILHEKLNNAYRALDAKKLDCAIDLDKLNEVLSICLKSNTEERRFSASELAKLLSDLPQATPQKEPKLSPAAIEDKPKSGPAPVEPQSLDYDYCEEFLDALDEHYHSDPQKEEDEDDESDITDENLVEDENDTSLHREIRDHLKRGRKGNADDMYDLGWYYMEGRYGRKSKKRANYWFKKSAEGGDPDALVMVGDWYWYGDCGMPKDRKKAFELYKLSAEKGCKAGMYSLGDCYAMGGGVQASAEQAVYWFEKAAKNNSVPGLKRLAVCYEIGFGVEKSPERAAECWMAAARAGNKYAQYKLAICYRDGKGVQVDEAEYRYWMESSAAKGYCQAKIELGQADHTICGDQHKPKPAKQAKQAKPSNPNTEPIQQDPPKPVKPPAKGAKQNISLYNDGSGTYTMPTSENIVTVAADLLRVVYASSESNYKFNQMELHEVVKMLKESNSWLKEYSFLRAGDVIILPKGLVQMLKAKLA